MGDLEILDPSIDVTALRSRVGMVFQRPTPFPMSIYDNVAYGVRLREKIAKADLDERVEWALRKAALWDDVKDKLTSARHLALRWPAAASVHCSRHRREA